MNHKKKSATDEKLEFEFCEVCRLNHNQGRRHNFFSKHKTSLSALLTRFQSKLSDIKFFLRAPVPLRPEQADRSRLWCIFCNCEILQLYSFYACDNVIEHLASREHWKRVKSFLWKYGGGVDRVDLFSISEVDLAKWENKCKSLKIEAAKEESVRPLKNIHNDLNADHVNGSCENSVNFCNINSSNSVLPLQSYTSEQTLASYSVLSSVPEASSSWHSMSGATNMGEAKCLQTSTGYMNNYPLNSVPWDCSSLGHHSNGSVNSGAKTAVGENASQALLNLTRISSASREAREGNIHTGAPPPWLSAPEGNPLEITKKPEQSKLFPSKSGKSTRLNPKRVGAAWAERRALELELERRGEQPAINGFDANWLPNFGRVWQSGTRKESRKEFQSEQHKSSLKVDDQPEEIVPLQPYVSKRMRTDTRN